ncbi:uncharacterized protein LOC124658385 [Lolium rigidum]|uniref:uncharacterized protein LOC124658385 n=1 Tax=Lolium rigidum TaxID=89674 RepID=UPI001F5C20AA|nr:uncharacterized protein LOC124658385 [Lolium rigidum]
METSQNKAPSFFNFLREGLLLPSRNWRLFTSVCALILASTTLIDLAGKPFANETKLDVKALNTTEPGTASPDFAKILIKEIQNGTKERLLASAGYKLFPLVVRSAVRIVVLFAAVFTYPGQERTITTFSALIGQAKEQIKGPLLTVAFVYVLETVLYVMFVATTSLLILPMVSPYVVTWLPLLFLFVLAMLLIFASLVCLLYFNFLGSFSVVLAVAEPGCYGVAALVKAWRLVQGKKRQVALYLAVTGALVAAVSPVRTLATKFAGNSVALGLLQGFACALLLALVQLFSDCTMTAFYYECRDKGANGYAKLL